MHLVTPPLTCANDFALRPADGGVDRSGADAALSDLATEGVSDVLVFSHGWNNDRPTAHRLYERFFDLLPPLLEGRLRPGRTVGLLGVHWPSKRWTDEPGPASDGAGSRDLGAGGGAAGIGDGPPVFEPPPPPDDGTSDALRSAFPDAGAEVGELVGLLRTRPRNEVDLQRAYDLVGELLQGAVQRSGTEEEGPGPVPTQAATRTAPEVIGTYMQALEDLGVVAIDGGGAVGITDQIGRRWHGVQELARQATYWQMKDRAGVVGERGLGPFVRELLDADLHVNLIGHSFGARLVSFALRAIGGHPRQVQSVTLLQGAFSQFAFADSLPFDRARSGALRGLQKRVAGPVTACYSRLDEALGTFYPLASVPAGQDAAAIEALQDRWGAVGFDGHKPRPNPAELNRPGTPYAFPAGALVSIDAARVVRNGRPPSGAHSDIVHAELAWIVLCAAGLTE